MVDLTSDVLIQRAHYGGRNLAGLAILATICAIFMVIGMFAFSSQIEVWIGIPAMLMAVSYWLLARGARRGNPLALSFVIGILAVQVCLSAAAQIFVQLRTNGAVATNIIWIVIPLLIIIALSRNRRDILELHQRGLWDIAFTGKPRATDRFCVLSGMLLIAAIVFLYGGLAISAFHAADGIKLRQEFVELIKIDEKQLLDDFAQPELLQNPRGVDRLLAKAQSLAAKTKSIADRAPADSGLKMSVTKYAEAVEKWKAGLGSIREKGFADANAQSLLSSGDEVRRKAIAEFNESISPPGRPRQ